MTAARYNSTVKPSLDIKRPRGAASVSLSLMRLNGVTYVQTVSMGFSRKSREMANPPHPTGGPANVGGLISDQPALR